MRLMRLGSLTKLKHSQAQYRNNTAINPENKIRQHVLQIVT